MGRIALALLLLCSLGGVAQPAQANEPPQITTISAIQRLPGVVVRFDVTTSDPDGDAVTLSAANLPFGASFTPDGSGNGSFFWFAEDEDVGFYPVTFIATDDGSPAETATADVAITIGNPNLPPELAAIGDQQVTVGETLVVPLSATDPEGDPITFSFQPALAGAHVVAGPSGTASFEYTPTAAAVGNQVVTFVASDGPGEDWETVVISVGGVNVPPALDPIGDRQVEVGGVLEIALAASDADGDSLAFSAEGLPDGVTLMDNGDSTARVSGSPSGEGVYMVTVTVTDDVVPSEAASETFEIDVKPPPAASDLVVLEARWSRGRLFVVGRGAAPGGVVTVHDAATGLGLGAATGDAQGVFTGKLRPHFVQPCAVSAHADGQMSDPVAVADAPRGCGEGLRTRVRAVWKCHRAALFLFGHRAPPNAAVRVEDADSGALLGQTSADRRGRVWLQASADARPGRVRVIFEIDGADWPLAAVEVHGDRYCRHRKHRHHHGDRCDHD